MMVHSPTETDPVVSDDSLILEVIREQREAFLVDKNLMELVSDDDRNIYTLVDDDDPANSFVKVDRFHQSGSISVRKEYRGIRRHLTELENERLLETEQRDLARTVSFKEISSRKFRRTKALEIIQPYVGLDLEKWSNLCQRDGRNSPFCSVAFLLNLVHQSLEALSELHKAGFVHCDVKLNNFCAPSSGVKLQEPDGNSSEKHLIEGTIELGQLMIIDLGLTLSCHRRSRRLAHDPDFVSPDGKQGRWLSNTTPDYVAPSYREATRKVNENGSFEPLEGVTWRSDLHSLGVTVEQLLRQYGDHLNSKDPGYAYLFGLPEALKSYDPIGPSQAEHPHETLMGEIGRALHGKLARSQAFAIPLQSKEVEAVKRALEKETITTAPSPHIRPIKLFAAVVLALFCIGAIGAWLALKPITSEDPGRLVKRSDPIFRRCDALREKSMSNQNPLPKTEYATAIRECGVLLSAQGVSDELRFDALMTRFVALEKTNQFQSALDDLKTAETIRSDNFGVDLNRALIFFRQGHAQDAFKAIQAANAKGWKDRDLIERDVDFKGLVEHPEYQAVRPKLALPK